MLRLYVFSFVVIFWFNYSITNTKMFMKKYLNAQLVSLFSHMQDWVQPRVMWFSRGVQVGKNFYEKVPLTIIVLKYSSLLSFFVIPYNSIERKSLSACITRLCRKSYDGTCCVQMQCQCPSCDINVYTGPACYQNFQIAHLDFLLKSFKYQSMNMRSTIRLVAE